MKHPFGSLNLGRKVKQGFWIDNECFTDTQRENVIQDLKNSGMEIDDLGECFNQACDESCLKHKAEIYYFIFVFENNDCSDYFSHLFYQSLMLPIVPVVLGGTNYSEISPPKSFIDVKEFNSTETLADYLIKLTQNETLYSEYFQWKSNHVLQDEPEALCKLCSLLYKTEPEKTYEDVHHWFYHDENNSILCPK